ncbi:MAG: DUF1786 domain-containing protein [Methanomicrobiales archaeon]|nr:DUF1786 domain-containing protein [Methanomicrobiales archaeon]
MTLLAADIGRGTQDILVYDPRIPVENCVKLVLPAPSVVFGMRIRKAREEGRSVHLTGTTMGGGENVRAVSEHIRAGLAVSATREAAKTIHDSLDRVKGYGIIISEEPTGTGAVTIRLSDWMGEEIRQALELFGVPMPEHVACAVQDHGFSPDVSNRIHRFQVLRSMLEEGGWRIDALAPDPPLPTMTRMLALRAQVPGALVIDTGPAAVMGALCDPVVRRMAGEGITLVNAGNAHTLAFTLQGEEVSGFFEHHTSSLDQEHLEALLGKLRGGTLTNDEVFREGGHGAAVHRPLDTPHVAITGPNRSRLLPDAYHAAPFGDMMLTGCFGLVRAWRRRRGEAPP